MTFVISFVVYTLLIIAIGIVSSRYQQKTDEDYFLAGRKLGPVLAALSASASSESGWVTLGLVGWAFQRGMTAYWILPGVLLGFIFNWCVLAGRMREHSERVGALPIPDVFSRSFKERVPILRILCVLVIRTADGTYAKVRILSYYKGAPETPDVATDEARYYTFEFRHQPDGSRVLE